MSESGGFSLWDVKPARLVLLAALAVSVAGCATTTEPRYPVYMQERPEVPVATPLAPPPSAIETSPMAEAPPISRQAAPGRVEASELAEMDLPPPPPPPPPTPANTRPATPAPASATTPSGAGFSYTMVAKDTLYGISRRFGVPVQTLYSLNGFDTSSVLKVGQKVLLPSSAKDGGVDPHAQGASPARLAGSSSANQVAAISPAPAPVRPVVSPPASQVASAPPPSSPLPTSVVPAPTPRPVATAPAPSSPAPSVPAVTVPAPSPVVTPAPRVTPPAPPPPSGFPTNSRLAEMGKGKFQWPVKGRVLVPFGQVAPSIRNDGINIQSASGTEVRAASDGVVVYQGDQVRELGNTVYIRHPGGWYTGYSHLAAIRVKNNQPVKQGDIIGTVGQTGAIDAPQLHFEVRYTPSSDIAKPIDPVLVLP